jgi:hypothetical protein
MQPTKNDSRRTVLLESGRGLIVRSRGPGMARYNRPMRLLTCLALMLAACSGESPARSSAAAATPAPAAKSSLRASVQRITSRGGEGIQMTERTDGTRIYHVTQGLGQVIVAKTNADGTVSAKCVESADDSFLDGTESQK